MTKTKATTKAAAAASSNSTLNYFERKRMAVTGERRPASRPITGYSVSGYDEAARFAHNIAVTLSDPETPADVREALTEYVEAECHSALEKLAECPAAIKALFPVARVFVSEIPFVAEASLVEVMIGADREAASRAARQLRDRLRAR